MKFGNGILPNLWNEFIFYGYYNYTDQAIFLSGIPDMDSTLPCHDNFSLTSEEKLSNESSNGLSEDDQLDFSDVPNVLSILEDEEFHELPEQLNGRKASEVFLDFSMPLLETIINDESNELDDIADSLMVPWMVWNASVYEFLNDKNEIHLSELMKKIPKDKQFREMISFFAKRKKEMFGQYNYILGEYNLIPKEEGGFNLTMASML
jgi:hypothetical protein